MAVELRAATVPALCCPPPTIISIHLSNDFVGDKLDVTTDILNAPSIFQCDHLVTKDRSSPIACPWTYAGLESKQDNAYQRCSNDLPMLSENAVHLEPQSELRGQIE
jgi:hypothetical protein